MDASTPSPSNPQVVVSAQPVPAYVVPQQPPRRSWFARLLVALLLMALFGSIMLNLILLALMGFSGQDADARVQEKHFSHTRHAPNKIAIFSIEGTILRGEGFFKRQIDHARREIEDGRLKAIVLRINSPGGTVVGSDYMLHHLRELRKETGVPIVVSMGGVAASGGYYVAMAVGDTPRTIFAEPSTWTGSIGVVIPHYNLAELFDKVGVAEDSITSHRLKRMGTLSRPMTDEEIAIFQALVDDGFTQFKDVIKQGRPKFRDDPDALERLATGQVFTAEQAKRAGLVDEIGFVEAAVDRAIELAGVDADNVEVVSYKAEAGLLDLLLGSSAARSQPAWDLAALLDLSAPRAYYLWTNLPPLAASRSQ
jgi:protease-4